jgi:hypothetical protein
MDGAASLAADNESVLPAKRNHQQTKQRIRGMVWAFHGEITTNLLPDDSDLPGLDDDDEKANFSRLQSRVKARLGDDFKLFFRNRDSYFLFHDLLRTFWGITFDT